MGYIRVTAVSRSRGPRSWSVRQKHPEALALKAISRYSTEHVAMRSYLRLPFIAFLFAVAVALSLISTFTKYTLVYEGELPYTAPARASGILYRLPLPDGLASVDCELPDGVVVYLLTYDDYELYNTTGELPSTYLDHERSHVDVISPKFILVVNTLDREVEFSMYVRVYSKSMPYAILAFPAYALTVVAIALIFLRLSVSLEKELTGEREGAPEKGPGLPHARASSSPMKASRAELPSAHVSSTTVLALPGLPPLLAFTVNEACPSAITSLSYPLDAVALP